ncbi:MAG: phosphodiester glycosidase family protein [Planctomycetota bacterium]
MLNTFAGCTAFSLLLIAIGLAGRWAWRYHQRPEWGRRFVAGFVLASLPTATLAGYLGWSWAEGQPHATQQTLVNGIEYERRVIDAPHPAVIHLVRIDLTVGHRLLVSSANLQTPRGPRCAALTATDALRRFNADLVINASYFRPFRDKWFLDYAPRHGAPVEAIGATISHGVRYGRDAPGWPSLCVQDDGGVFIGSPDQQTRHAVSGDTWLVQDSKPLDHPTAFEQPYPRTAVGLSADRRVLWLVVVDGKQPRYSEGLGLSELAALLQELGVADAINLDGGGSSTLAVRDDGTPRVLSRPCHTKIPRRQRPVANHLVVVFGPEK